MECAFRTLKCQLSLAKRLNSELRFLIRRALDQIYSWMCSTYKFCIRFGNDWGDDDNDGENDGNNACNDMIGDGDGDGDDLGDFLNEYLASL